MSRYNTQVLSNIRMLCRMQNIDEKVLYERAKQNQPTGGRIGNGFFMACTQTCTKDLYFTEI